MDTNATRRIRRGGSGPKPVGDTPVHTHESRTFLFFLVSSLFVHAVFLGSLWLLQKPGKVHKSVELINISVTSLPGPAGGGGESEEIKPPPKEIKKEEIPEKEQVKVVSKRVEKKLPELKKKPEAEASKVAHEAPKGPGQGPVGGGKLTEDAVQGAVEVVGGKDFPYAWYIAALQKKVYSNWHPLRYSLKNIKQPVIFFSIDRNGKVKNPEIREKSGIDSLDRSALSAIIDLKQMPPLPAGFRGDSLDILYTFIPENK